MRTTKPIATISYNTPAFLELKLKELLQAKIISVWHFIRHLAEDDEAGKKPHIHLYIEPSKLLQTDDLKAEFVEYDPKNPTKPLNCLPFRSSKWGDWYYYILHDTAYLASKGQRRRYHYTHDDIATSDADELYRASKMIDTRKLIVWQDMQDAVADGLSFMQWFKQSGRPVQQINSFSTAFELLGGQGYTYRAGKRTHTPRE